MTPDERFPVRAEGGIVRPIFECDVYAHRNGRKRGTLLWRIWWHHGDKVWWLPMWLWKPVCWLSRKGHTNDSYGACVICRKPMPKVTALKEAS